MFKLVSKYKPTGPTKGNRIPVKRNNGRQEIPDTSRKLRVLGKTFIMANIIEKTQKPTLVLAHNKTLAR